MGLTTSDLCARQMLSTVQNRQATVELMELKLSQ